uniref:SH2 domain-containing protein n=1 Tax=Caenorhabditis tropicalis TaxID=1561998 RepID=A0A1I7UL86_9PELO
MCAPVAEWSKAEEPLTEEPIPIQFSPIPPPPNEISIITQNDFKNRESSSAYIGIQTLSDAENRLTNRGEFALYHLFTSNSLDSLTDRLPLMLVYRTTTKKNRHYSIRLTADHKYFVDCGYPNVRKHYSLNQLVMFYKFSAMFEINPDDTSSDSFSWWLE